VPTPENRVKDRLNKALKPFGRALYRFMPVQTGYGRKTLDYLLCYHGHFIAIETKAPGKKMTPLQEETACQIIAAGGTVFMVDGSDGIDRVVGDLIRTCPSSFLRQTKPL
jgi:hypothetical protein